MKATIDRGVGALPSGNLGTMEGRRKYHEKKMITKLNVGWNGGDKVWG